eukprot:1152426-Pelagomonas_calceolata.AAC.3
MHTSGQCHKPSCGGVSTSSGAHFRGTHTTVQGRPPKRQRPSSTLQCCPVEQAACATSPALLCDLAFAALPQCAPASSS